jgi:hypothetical protein
MTAYEEKRQTRYYVQMDALIESLADRFTKPAEAILAAEGRRAADAYEKLGRNAAIAAPDESVWADYLRRLWITAAPEAADVTAEWIGVPPDVKAARRQPLGRMSTITAANQKIRELAPSKAYEIAQTSRELIRQSIEATAVLPGGTVARIASQILTDNLASRGTRARRVAHTESHESANFGSIDVARLVSRALDKVWLSLMDGKQRDAHGGAHKQRRRLEQNFTVGGEILSYPGDSSLGASASNLVNCRCVLGFVRKTVAR